MEKLGTRIVAFGILFFLSMTIQAEIYKWVDEHGQTHYGEKPPAHKKAKQVQLRNHSGSPSNADSVLSPAETPKDTTSRLEKQKKLIRALSDDRKAKQEEREKQQRMEKQRTRNCAIAKDNLRRYESSSSVYKVDDKGNRITLPGSERDKSIQRARAEVKKWCSS